MLMLLFITPRKFGELACTSFALNSAHNTGLNHDWVYDPLYPSTQTRTGCSGAAEGLVYAWSAMFRVYKVAVCDIPLNIETLRCPAGLLVLRQLPLARGPGTSSTRLGGANPRMRT